LEYIQCPQCEKKYTVNDKLKAATGKQIRCKHCQQAFEIVIHDDSRAPEPQINSEPVVSNQPAEAQSASRSDNQAPSSDLSETSEQDSRKEEPEPAKAGEDQTPSEEKKKAPSANKKVNVQALISMVLGVILICASVGGYLFLNKPELFGIATQPAPKPIIPHKLVNPMASDLPRPAISKQAPLSAANQNGASTPQSGQSLKICKALSADYWIRTRLLATAKLDTSTYIALLNMNLEQAQEIRKLCKEQSLVAKLAEAARTDKKPQWIKTEIDARLKQHAQGHARKGQNP